MHPTIGYQLNQDHLTDLHHQARHTALARTARRARPHRPRSAAPIISAAGRRALAVLRTRST